MNSRKYITQLNSLHAPGLTYAPPLSELQRNKKMLLISNINYDYLATNLDGPKTLWVELNNFPPQDFVVGKGVYVHLSPKHNIATSDTPALNSLFEVVDIIGKRVILQPYKGATWLPTTHSACDSHFGWGYSTRIGGANPRLANAGSGYGYGVPVSYIEYFPVTFKELERKFTSQVYDYYRDTTHFPRW